MNDNRKQLDDPRIARLVDGELTGDEYRQTLQILESEDGWRRCALAFLETQALGQAITHERIWDSEAGTAAASADGQVVHPRSSDQRNTVHAAADHDLASVLIPLQKTKSAWRLALATAASFFIAFGLGLAAQSFLGGMKGEVDLAHRPHAVPAEGDAQPVNERPGGSQHAPLDSARIADQREVALPPSGSERESPSSVRLVVDNGRGGWHEMNLPVQGLDEAMRQSLAGDDLPPQLLEMLRQSGHDLHRHQQLIPVSLGDGSQLVIPVEQMRIVPMGRRDYQ